MFEEHPAPPPHPPVAVVAAAANPSTPVCRLLAAAVSFLPAAGSFYFLLMLFADKPEMPPQHPPPPVAVLAAAIPPPFPVFTPKPFTWRTKLQPKANQKPTPSVAPTGKSTPVLPPKGSQQQKPGVAPVATSKAEPPSPYYHCILQRQGDRSLSLKQLRHVEFTVHSYLPRSASTRPISFLVQEQAT